MKQSELHFRIRPLQRKDRFKEEGGRVVRYVSSTEIQVRAYIRQPKLNYREEEWKERENGSNKGELSEGEEDRHQRERSRDEVREDRLSCRHTE